MNHLIKYRTLNKVITSYRSLFTNQNLKLQHYPTVGGLYRFNNQLIDYFDNTGCFNHMLRNIEAIKDEHEYKQNVKPSLKTCFNDLSLDDLLSLHTIVDSNLDTIEPYFNKHGYYKYKLVSNNILTSYLIIWGKGAESDIHYHASNGCFTLNLGGVWREDIYFKDNLNKIRHSRMLYGGDTSYIDNHIGPHKLKLNGGSFGLSVNIYSPSIEL